MKKALLEWIEDVLSPWFVPKEDYYKVQEYMFEAYRQKDAAVAAADRAYKEMYEVMDKQYGSRFQGFEQIYNADPDAIMEQRIERLEFDEFEYRWSMRITRKMFAMNFDIKKEINRIRQFVIAKMTYQFRLYITKQLFR